MRTFHSFPTHEIPYSDYFNRYFVEYQELPTKSSTYLLLLLSFIVGFMKVLMTLFQELLHVHANDQFISNQVDILVNYKL